VNDIESDVRTRLHRLADDVTLGDPLAEAGRARVRYRRQRRTRAGLVAVAAAVVAIVIGVPTALGAFSAAPDGDVARQVPVSGTPATSAAAPSDHEDERIGARWSDTLENRAERDARLGPVAERLRTALASRGEPIALPLPPAGTPCPDWTAPLSSVLGTAVTPDAGDSLAAGCRWSGPEVSVEVQLAADASREQLGHEVNADDAVNGCYPTALPGTELFTTLSLCENAGGSTWRMRVLASGGTGFWTLTVTVPDGVDAAQTAATVLTLADATW
jgi:hypothetical protein